MMSPVLCAIILTNLIAGALSIAIAAWFSFALLSRLAEKMVSFSIGLLLATAFLHTLPEAFASKADPEVLFHVLFFGLLSFFLLEKLTLLRHSHHHEGDGHGHHRGYDAANAGKSGVLILVGDGVHNFVDGILIAAAFLVDFSLGVMTAMAIIAHEIPQEVSDFMVLLNAGFSKTRALIYNGISSLMALAGGCLGYTLIEQTQTSLPYLLAFAASSFIYIALSDLIPQLQKRLSWRELWSQLLFIVTGILVVLLGLH